MDKNNLDEILKETLQRILKVVKPKKVILFGSAALGSMGANSDIDLLVVVPSGVHRRRTAQNIYRNMVGVGFAADIVVVTEDDVERYGNRPGMIIMQAVDEGRILYAAA
jgi:predicted nucleotidyltransferase